MKTKFYKLTASDISALSLYNEVNNANFVTTNAPENNIVSVILTDVLNVKFVNTITAYETQQEFETQLKFAIRSNAFSLTLKAKTMMNIRDDLTTLMNNGSRSESDTHEDSESISQSETLNETVDATSFGKSADTPTRINLPTDYIDEYSDSQSKTTDNQTRDHTKNKTDTHTRSGNYSKNYQSEANYDEYIERINKIRDTIYSEVYRLFQPLFFEPFNTDVEVRPVLNPQITADVILTGYQGFDNNDNIITGTLEIPEVVNIEQSSNVTVSDIYSGEFWVNIDESYDGKTISATGENHVGVSFPIAVEPITVTANGSYSLDTLEELPHTVDVAIPEASIIRVNTNLPITSLFQDSFTQYASSTYRGLSIGSSTRMVLAFPHTTTPYEITSNGDTDLSTLETLPQTIRVNVPSDTPVLETLNVTANGTYTPTTGVDGYNEVNVNVPSDTPVLETLNVTANGTYTPTTGVDGYNEVNVNVPSSGGFKSAYVNISQATNFGLLLSNLPSDLTSYSQVKYMYFGTLMPFNPGGSASLFGNHTVLSCFEDYTQNNVTASIVVTTSDSGDTSITSLYGNDAGYFMHIEFHAEGVYLIFSQAQIGYEIAMGDSAPVTYLMKLFIIYE